jgi:CRISPR-associated endoribonuclease Cas6
MYQLLLRLQAARDCAWERQYHRRIRGRLGQTLQRADIDDYRETQRPPFAFSDLMPVRDDQHPGTPLNEGDGVHLLIATPRMDIMKAIAGDLQRNPELTAGSMVFETRAAKPLKTDVGEPGSEGVLTTGSGIIVALDGNDTESEHSQPEYWTERKHSVHEFKTALSATIDRVLGHETAGTDTLRPYFSDYQHLKTYASKIRVTPAQTLTVVASKWDLDYHVRDEAHREALNALLGTGVGRRRSYGFGMLQTRDNGAHEVGA